MHLKQLVGSLGITRSQMVSLLWAREHSPYLQRHRAAIVISRVQLVSAVFAVLTPLWILVDAVAFAWPAWGILGGIRLFSSAVFLALAWPWEFEKTQRNAFLMLTAMLVNPPLFYLVSIPLFHGVPLDGLAAIVAALYALLPFVAIAGLSVFPLTILEALLYASPVMVLAAVGAAFAGTGFSWPTYIGNMWLLGLIFGVGALAGAGQLNYMIALVSRASQDPLTGVFTRRSGGEIIDLQYRVAERHDSPFAIAFFDLDNFKSINDRYGHEEGDAALRTLVNALRAKLRLSDIIVRWGGEEFVVVLTNTDANGVRLVLRRIMQDWLGNRPDGGLLTASIGVAERKADGIGDWPKLVELADQRMYQAKKAGKARSISCCGEEILPGSG
ncbi:MAG: GGDEF domain-containing protein [Magnetospirillum sp. WYHS-4]